MNMDFILGVLVGIGAMIVLVEMFDLLRMMYSYKD